MRSALFPKVNTFPMDLYLTSLALGGVGLVAMAMSGFGRHGHGNSSAHGGAHNGAHGGGHGHSGDGHGGHGHAGDGHAGHGHAGHGTAGHVDAGHGHAAHGGAHAASHGASHASHHAAPDAAHHATAHAGGTSQVLLALMSPRLLFSVCLGLGTTGVLLRNSLTEPLLFGAALAGGILFERFIVTPIWNFTFRFASNPALTLESALLSEATAVTRFDANGQGIIAIEVDGQMVQLLGTLQSDDRAMGARVLAGARLRVEDVDAARNRCTVSLV